MSATDNGDDVTEFSTINVEDNEGNSGGARDLIDTGREIENFNERLEIDVERVRGVVNLAQAIESQLGLDLQSGRYGVIVHSIEIQFLRPVTAPTLGVRLSGIKDQVTELQLKTPPPSPKVSPSPSMATMVDQEALIAVTPPPPSSHALKLALSEDERRRNAYIESLNQGLVFPRSTFTIFSQKQPEFRRVRDYGHLTPETIDRELYTDIGDAPYHHHHHPDEMVKVRPDSILTRVLRKNASAFPSFREEEEPAAIYDPDSDDAELERYVLLSYNDWQDFKESFLYQTYQTYAYIDTTAPDSFKLEFIGNEEVERAQIILYLTIVKYLS